MRQTAEANTPPPGDSLEKAALAFIREFEELHCLNSVGFKLSDVGNRYYALNRQAQFIEDLVESVRQQKPLSVIRLGDGEGNVLLASEAGASHNELAEYGLSKIWAVMFGRRTLSVSDKQAFLTDFVESVQAADVIGLPTAKQVEHKITTITSDGNKDYRGLAGILGDWYWFAKNEAIFDDPVRRYGIWHYHIRLGDRLQEVLSASRHVSAITCYPDFLEIMRHRYGFEPGIVLTIPPQAVNIKGTPDEVHYPDRYQQICHALNQDLSGHTFLVGAGLLGKMYCAKIKQSGGIAIDIGSLIDVLIGHSVRPWHSAEALERFSIRKPE